LASPSRLSSSERRLVDASIRSPPPFRKRSGCVSTTRAVWETQASGVARTAEEVHDIALANKAVEMKFLLLTYNAPGGQEIWAAMTESERRAEEDEYVRLPEAMRETNAHIAAHELEPFFTARTVRVRNGKRTVTDGPAVHGEEFLTGYFLIEAESIEDALGWAAKVPNARNGSVEVRQVIEDELAERMAAKLDNSE
jgi:hypothetical protein